MKPDDRVIRALALLRNPELQPFVQYLKDWRTEVLEDLANPDVSADFAVTQGRAKMLKELLELIAKGEQVQQRNQNMLQPVQRL